MSKNSCFTLGGARSLKMSPARLIVLTLALCFSPEGLGEEVEFLRDIRPILSQHCFKCHGPDAGTRKAGLRLDVREDALQPAKSGEVAIVPNDPATSELIKRIFTDDEDDLMPPPAAKNPLSGSQKEKLKKWIASGAEYAPHWAFVPPKEAAPPQAKDRSWAKNPIDQFVLARLEKEGLKPSPAADKYALVRRVYLDLIGLPPTPEQADEFVNDSSPSAYEKLVDKLLASPHYGERWARRWLDLARYADTNGYEKDRPRSIWPYRDWVIKALNADLPFDQFTIEQLAGDMLPNPALDQLIATGFHRNTMINEEGGIDPLEYRFYAMVDRVHVTATTWLGLTMACAQCHTHKFDPIQQSEYYQFMAFLNNADEPRLPVPQPDVSQKRRELEEKIASLQASLPERFPVEVKANWFVPGAASFQSQHGAQAELLADGSFRVSGDNPDKDTYTIELDAPSSPITHLQIEAIPDDQVAKGGPGRTDHGNFVITEVEMEWRGGGEKKEPRKVKFARAEADITQEQFATGATIDGKDGTGWAPGIAADRRLHRRLILTLAEPIRPHLDPLPQGEGREGWRDKGRVTIRLGQQYGKNHTLGRFRVSLGSELPDPRSLAERRRAHLERKFAKWIEAERPVVIPWLQLTPTEAKSKIPVLTIEKDGGVFASGDFSKSDTYTLKFRDLPKNTKALRIEALPDERLPKNGPGTVSYEGPEGDFWLSTLKVTANQKPVELKNATESFANGGSTAAKAIDDDLQSGWSVDGRQGEAHSAVFQLATPLSETEELQLDLTFERYYAAGLGRFRVWVATNDNARASSLPEAPYQALLKHQSPDSMAKLLASPDSADYRALLAHFVRVSPDLVEERKEIERLRSRLPEHPTTLALRERPEGHQRATHRHHRGEFLQAKEEVEPGVPSFLPPLPADAPRNRLGFAKWLVSPSNPLTARVVINRHWEAFFGRGLVRTLEDFGFQGELPSHPELLDWLALEFIRQGWSQKKMHKLIVSSATYRQSGHFTPELLERDPQNILLARGPRLRVEAELVRDATLVASGLFSDKMFGPSVFPPQPAGVSTEGAYRPLEWKVSEGPDRYRRGLYTYAKRTTPFAMTATFDGPSGEACLARRDRSNTPLQALTLLNDEVFMEAARALGRWAASQEGGVDAVVEKLFRRCLTRPPSSSEKQKIIRFYEAQLDRFNRAANPAEIAGSSQDAAVNKQAAWTAVARVLLNLDETIVKS